MFNWWTFVFQIINFAVVAYLLYRLLFKPVREIILKRQEKLSSERDTLEKEKNRIIELKRELDEKLNKLDELKKTMIEETRAEAQLERKRILEETSKEIEAKWKGLEKQLEERRKKLQEELKKEAIELAGELSKGLLTSLWNEGLNESLINRTLGEIKSLNSEAIEEILAGYKGCAVEVVSASELSEQIKRGITETLNHVFSCQTDITYRVVPEYIGGVAIRVNSRVFDGTVLGNITRALETLRGHQP
ncbi:MAG: hypothetical protein D6710_10080 [Nitrospirae bacterium]|nr:MAG: hypothetical protein D6710_10080 [Nitrospirota bacterium]